jgi:hypothetical protein
LFLKIMTLVPGQVADDFVAFLDDSRGQAFDTKEVFTSFTLDVIASAGLGVQVSIQ